MFFYCNFLNKVAARGIDVPEVDLVIQAGLPRNGIEYYIHRSGRTGRAGRLGSCVSLVEPYDEKGDNVFSEV